MGLRDEILEQPQVIARLLEGQEGEVRGIADALRAQEIAYVLIAARGTSDNAARYGQYLLELLQDGGPVT